MKLNTPNKLILIRFFLTIFVIILTLIPFWWPNFGNINLNTSKLSMDIFDLIAMIFFIIASITDWLDGYLARKNNQITNFGKLFDPLADKVLINSVLIIFTVRGIIPIIVTLLFIIRDILVDGLRMMLSSNGIVLAAKKLGKLKTVFQMIGLTLLFIIKPNDFISLEGLILVPLYIGLFYSIWSGIYYYIKGFKELNV